MTKRSVLPGIHVSVAWFFAAALASTPAAGDDLTLMPWDAGQAFPAASLAPAPASGASTIEPHARAPLLPAVSAAAKANNEFAFDLFAELRAGKSSGDNMLASPLSISTALGMTYAGARGETARQIASVLGFDQIPGGGVHDAYGGWITDLNTPREGYELAVANRLFGQQGFAFRQPFLDQVSSAYGAPLEELDFYGHPDPAREHINAWVESQTRDRIRNLLPQGSITSDTRLVLTNALYFNGKWKYEFDEADTQERSFFTTGAAEIQVDTMMQSNRFRYGDFDGYQMLEMPYAGDDLSMVVVLPDAVDGLAALESTLTAGEFQANVDNLTMQTVNVFLPKFTFGDQASLRPPLESLGMTDAFANADFSGIAPEADLSISDVLHKTFIDVSESGTEAAAATAVVIGVTSIPVNPPPPAVFNADHPFLFAIRDNHTGGLLFLGRMADPGQAQLAAVPEPSAGALTGLALLAAAYCIRRR